jgi:hypothetical protein
MCNLTRQHLKISGFLSPHNDVFIDQRFCKTNSGEGRSVFGEDPPALQCNAWLGQVCCQLSDFVEAPMAFVTNSAARQGWPDCRR